MVESVNRRRQPAPIFQPGQNGRLLRRRIRSARPSAKLDVRRLGPFPVVGPVGRSGYRLDFPDSLRINPVFHVSLLEQHISNPFPGRFISPPPPITVDGEPEYEISSILHLCLHRGGLQYLVDQPKRSWLPASDLSNAIEVVAEFHVLFPGKPPPRPASATAP